MVSFWESHSVATAMAKASLGTVKSLACGVFSLRWSRFISKPPGESEQKSWGIKEEQALRNDRQPRGGLGAGAEGSEGSAASHQQRADTAFPLTILETPRGFARDEERTKQAGDKHPALHKPGLQACCCLVVMTPGRGTRPLRAPEAELTFSLRDAHVLVKPLPLCGGGETEVLKADQIRGNPWCYHGPGLVTKSCSFSHIQARSASGSSAQPGKHHESGGRPRGCCQDRPRVTCGVWQPHNEPPTPSKWLSPYARLPSKIRQGDRQTP